MSLPTRNLSSSLLPFQIMRGRSRSSTIEGTILYNYLLSYLPVFLCIYITYVARSAALRYVAKSRQHLTKAFSDFPDGNAQLWTLETQNTTSGEIFKGDADLEVKHGQVYFTMNKVYNLKHCTKSTSNTHCAAIGTKFL